MIDPTLRHARPTDYEGDAVPTIIQRRLAPTEWSLCADGVVERPGEFAIILSKILLLKFVLQFAEKGDYPPSLAPLAALRTVVRREHNIRAAPYPERVHGVDHLRIHILKAY